VQRAKERLDALIDSVADDMAVWTRTMKQIHDAKWDQLRIDGPEVLDADQRRRILLNQEGPHALSFHFERMHCSTLAEQLANCIVGSNDDDVVERFVNDVDKLQCALASAIYHGTGEFRVNEISDLSWALRALRTDEAVLSTALARSHPSVQPHLLTEGSSRTVRMLVASIGSKTFNLTQRERRPVSLKLMDPVTSKTFLLFAAVVKPALAMVYQHRAGRVTAPEAMSVLLRSESLRSEKKNI
jgi:hypothetical protein